MCHTIVQDGNASECKAEKEGRERMGSGNERHRVGGRKQRNDNESEGKKACALGVIPSFSARTRSNEKQRKEGQSEREGRASATLSGALRLMAQVFR